MAAFLLLLAMLGGALVGDLIWENTANGEATVLDRTVAGYPQGWLLAAAAGIGFVVALLLVASLSSTKARRNRRRQLRALRHGQQEQAYEPDHAAWLQDPSTASSGPPTPAGPSRGPPNRCTSRRDGATWTRTVAGSDRRGVPALRLRPGAGAYHGWVAADARGCAVTDDELRQLLLDAKVIAVVGLSANPDRPSNQVAWYLHHQGYRLFGVNPRCPEAEVFGIPMVPSLDQVPEPIDIVDVFRRPEHTPEVARAAVAAGAAALWLQLGIASPEARAIATDAGLAYVEDRCLKVDHVRLLGRSGRGRT